MLNHLILVFYLLTAVVVSELLVHLVVGQQFTRVQGLFFEHILLLCVDLGIEVVEHLVSDFGLDHSESIFVRLDARKVFLRLLIVVKLFTQTLPSLAIFSLNLMTAPVTLHDQCRMLDFLIHNVVHVLGIQVLNEVVLTSHGLDAFLNLIALL